MTLNIINKRAFIAAGIYGLLLGVTSCKKQLDINQDPNVPTLAQGTPALVFPGAVVGTAAKTGGDLAIIGGIWSQYFTQSSGANQYTTFDAYNMPTTDAGLDSVYTGLFVYGLKNYQYVIDQSKAKADWNFYLMGTVMKAYTAGVLVDLFDKIPYSQALQGTGNLNPAFDDGYSIYTALLKSIDSALGKDFTVSTNTTAGTQDLVFSGDMTKWKAFANTLKLKFYLRMVNAHNDVATAGINKLYSDNVAFLTTDAALSNFTDAPNQDNPMYEQNIRSLNSPTNLRASATLATWLIANNDPRANDYFGQPTPGYMNQGDYQNNTPANQASSIFVEAPTDPVEFISKAESYFLQAEARVRYFGGANAKEAYDKGVTAAFAAVGEDATSFIAPGGAYEWGAEMENGQPLSPINQIIRQKWAHFVYGSHSIEAFFDKNRTGFPAISPVYSTDPSYVPGQLVTPPTSVLPAGTLPKRMVYPYDETSRNTNAPKTIVPITTPVWWGL